MEDKTMETSNLIKALTSFHSNLGKICKTSENPYFKSNYADMAALLDIVDKPLSEAGLAFIGAPEYRDGHFIMVCRIEHISGEYREGIFPIFGNKPQELGSSITYARRYLLQSLLNLAAQDDDGNDANKAPITPTHETTKKQATLSELEERNNILAGITAQMAGKSEGERDRWRAQIVEANKGNDVNSALKRILAECRGEKW